MDSDLIIAISSILFAGMISFGYFFAWSLETEIIEGKHRVKLTNGKGSIKKFVDNKFVVISGIVNVGYCLLFSLYELIACLFYPPMGLINVRYICIPLMLLPIIYFCFMGSYMRRKVNGIKYKKNDDGEVQYDDDEE